MLAGVIVVLVLALAIAFLVLGAGFMTTLFGVGGATVL